MMKSDYPIHPKFAYRPPTPPSSFRNGGVNLWRSHPIHLSHLTDSDTPPNKPQESTNSKSSGSEHGGRASCPPTINNKYTQVDVVCSSPTCCHPQDSVVVRPKVPLNVVPEVHDRLRRSRKSTRRNRQEVFPSEEPHWVPCDSPAFYSDWSHASNRQDGRFYPFSDSNVVLGRKQRYESDSSTSTISNASLGPAVQRRAKPNYRVKKSSSHADYCVACVRSPEYYFPSGRSLPPAHAGDSTSLQKIRQLESEKKNLLLQVSVLNDQIEAQSDKIRELENSLEDKKEQLRLAEQNLHQEMMTRSAIENSKLEMMTEISSLRLRLTASERDRKSSDEKYRKIENDLLALHERLAVGEDRSLLRMKISRNGTVMSSTERQCEIDKLQIALESVISSNEEKDKKIEELRLALLKCRKLQDMVLAGHGHQRKTSDVSVNNVRFVDQEVSADVSPGNDSIKSQSLKFHGKPPTGQRTPFSIPSSTARGEFQQKESFTSIASQTALDSESRIIQSLQKSSSLENIRQVSSTASSPKNTYGTIPRQSGPQVLQRLEEQLQNIDSSSLPSSKVQAFDVPSFSPKETFPKGLHRSRVETGKESSRSPRNKSSGVSFGKGFFKLRSGKRSSSAPELAPFESITIPIEEREVSSASPTPQPTMQPFFIKPEKERNRGLLRFLTKWKRSGSQNIEKLEGDFHRGGIRATAGPRLGWSRDLSIDPDIPFSHWGNDVIAEWLHKMGLSMYMGECRRWKCNGEQLLNSSPSDIEKELNVKNPMHKKKITLALQHHKSDDIPAAINEMDYQWVVRWLDDIGLPQYKDSFSDARVDGRVLHYLTVDDLLYLKVTNQLHHISIKRGIQVLRERNFDPHCLIRRSTPDEDKNYTPEYVSLWTNHRVMEWLRTVDLSEYAPNLRGSGVHGALIVYEVKFNTDLFATLLNIPPTKTLLRRHLTTHFKTIIGSEYIQAKRDVEMDQMYIPLTPNEKIKAVRKPQFALKKRKSKGETESEEFVCPMDIPVGSTTPPRSNGERLIVRRNSDPTLHESKNLTEKDEKSSAEIEAVSKEITSLTDILQKETLLKNAPTTNV